MNKQKRSQYGEEESQEFSVQFIPDKSGTYVIEIDDAIESPKQFSTAVQILGMAKEDDSIEVRITNCPGGNVGATDGFLHAMRKCPAHVHMIACGGVHSMGTQILLEADSFELGNGFHALIHCGQDGAYGNVNEYRAKSKFDEDFGVRKFKEAYEGFLSNKEMDDMLEGKDIWLDAQQWCERAEKRSHYFKAKYEKMMKDQNKKPRAKKAQAAPEA